jgi:hypothetical protein
MVKRKREKKGGLLLFPHPLHTLINLGGGYICIYGTHNKYILIKKNKREKKN